MARSAHSAATLWHASSWRTSAQFLPTAKPVDPSAVSADRTARECAGDLDPASLLPRDGSNLFGDFREVLILPHHERHGVFATMGQCHHVERDPNVDSLLFSRQRRVQRAPDAPAARCFCKVGGQFSGTSGSGPAQTHPHWGARDGDMETAPPPSSSASNPPARAMIRPQRLPAASSRSPCLLAMPHGVAISRWMRPSSYFTRRSLYGSSAWTTSSATPSSSSSRGISGEDGRRCRYNRSGAPPGSCQDDRHAPESAPNRRWTNTGRGTAASQASLAPSLPQPRSLECL